MTWPTPQEYNEAIQNPNICFVDPELVRGAVELNALGLPRSMTGAFASVYKLVSDSGSFAVRCFLSNRQSQKERYEKISQYVAVDDLDCTVSFCYVERGIRVKGQWFPVLKMQWLDGQTLGEYVDEHYGDKEKIGSLRAKFRDMVAALEKAGVAHGDLQNGNLIVKDENLFLIDYDALFVPALLGLPSLEFGHPNFQHPERRPEHFDDSVDNFSTWLIDISLQVIESDFRLYRLLDGGDDCLIFRQKDLVMPETSDVFRVLLEHPLAEIRYSASLLIRMLWANPESIPALDCHKSELDRLPRFIPNKYPDNNTRQNEASRETAAGTSAEKRINIAATGTRYDIILEDSPQKKDRLSDLKARSTVFLRHMGSDIGGGLDKGWRSMNPSGWMDSRKKEADLAYERLDFKAAARNYLDAYHVMKLVVECREQRLGAFDSFIAIILILLVWDRGEMKRLFSSYVAQAKLSLDRFSGIFLSKRLREIPRGELANLLIQLGYCQLHEGSTTGASTYFLLATQEMAQSRNSPEYLRAVLLLSLSRFMSGNLPGALKLLKDTDSICQNLESIVLSEIEPSINTALIRNPLIKLLFNFYELNNHPSSLLALRHFFRTLSRPFPSELEDIIIPSMVELGLVLNAQRKRIDAIMQLQAVITYCQEQESQLTSLIRSRLFMAAIIRISSLEQEKQRSFNSTFKDVEKQLASKAGLYNLDSCLDELEEVVIACGNRDRSRFIDYKLLMEKGSIASLLEATADFVSRRAAVRYLALSWYFRISQGNMEKALSWLVTQDGPVRKACFDIGNRKFDDFSRSDSRRFLRLVAEGRKLDAMHERILTELIASLVSSSKSSGLIALFGELISLERLDAVVELLVAVSNAAKKNPRPNEVEFPANFWNLLAAESISYSIRNKMVSIIFLLGAPSAKKALSMLLDNLAANWAQFELKMLFQELCRTALEKNSGQLSSSLGGVFTRGLLHTISGYWIESCLRAGHIEMLLEIIGSSDDKFGERFAAIAVELDNQRSLVVDWLSRKAMEGDWRQIDNFLGNYVENEISFHHLIENTLASLDDYSSVGVLCLGIWQALGKSAENFFTLLESCRRHNIETGSGNGDLDLGDIARFKELFAEEYVKNDCLYEIWWMFAILRAGIDLPVLETKSDNLLVATAYDALLRLESMSSIEKNRLGEREWLMEIETQFAYYLVASGKYLDGLALAVRLKGAFSTLVFELMDKASHLVLEQESLRSMIEIEEYSSIIDSLVLLADKLRQLRGDYKNEPYSRVLNALALVASNLLFVWKSRLLDENQPEDRDRMIVSEKSSQEALLLLDKAMGALLGFGGPAYPYFEQFIEQAADLLDEITKSTTDQELRKELAKELRKKLAYRVAVLVEKNPGSRELDLSKLE